MGRERGKTVNHGTGKWLLVDDKIINKIKQQMKKLKTSQKGSQKSIQISGCSTQIGIQTNRELLIEDKVYGSNGLSGGGNKFHRKTNRYQLLRKEHSNYKEVLMGQLLEELFTRRKRFSFQMTKLQYMFPDDTFSETISVNSYDRLFYNDEHIHTIVKIYETKEMEAKIWAFINLLNLHKKRKLQKFTAKIEKVNHRLIGTEFKYSFDLINQFSIKIKPELKPKPEPSKVLSQRKQVIFTGVQHPKVRSGPLKTQRLNTTNANTNNDTKTNSTRDSNEIMRISTFESSPIVRRIQLAPDSGVRIYPTSIPQTIRTSNYEQTNIKNIYETKEVRDTTNITRTQIISPSIQKNESRLRYANESETKTLYPSRTHFGSQKRIQYTRPSTIYQAHSIRNIETVPIQTSAVYYTRPTEVREVQDVRQVNRNYYGSGQKALVHTVHGDCTINIHNYCDHPRQELFQGRVDLIQERNGSITKRKHTRSNSRQEQNYESYRSNRSSSKPRVLESYGSQQYERNHLKRSDCSYRSCQPVCSCAHHGYHQLHSQMRGGYNPSDPYSIEERISYLRHLEHISQPNFANYPKNMN